MVSPGFKQIFNMLQECVLRLQLSSSSVHGKTVRIHYVIKVKSAQYEALLINDKNLFLLLRIDWTQTFENQTQNKPAGKLNVKCKWSRLRQITRIIIKKVFPIRMILIPNALTILWPYYFQTPDLKHSPTSSTPSHMENINFQINEL